MKTTRLSSLSGYTILGLYALFSLAPLAWMVSISLRTPKEAFLPTLLPSAIVFANYCAAIGKFKLSFLNSLSVSLVATALSLGLGTLAAYGLSRYSFRGKAAASMLVVSTRLLPPVLLVMGLFTAFQRIRLYDSLTAVVLADTLYTLPFAVWMLRNYFDSIPRSLDEAALVDGASVSTVVTRVMFPLARPGVVATAVYCFLLAWNDLLYALTFILSEQKKLVTVVIAEQSGEWWTNYPEMMAMATLFTVPLLLAFVLVQRSLVTGLSAGAIKS